VVAAELTQQANDLQQLAPMLTAIRTTLAAAGIGDPLQRLAADSGYWSIANVSAIPEAPEPLIPPARHGRHGKPRKDGQPSASKSDGLRAAMRAKLDSAQGKACYASAAGLSSRSSGRSRPSEAAGGSCAEGCEPVRPNGSCCAAPTTCSSCGARPRPPPADRHQPPGTASAGPNESTKVDATAQLWSAGGQPATPFSNGLLKVNDLLDPG
jgi:hypothetical protein